MGDKAEKNDLTAHISAPPERVHGIFDRVRDFVARKIAEALAALVRSKISSSYLTSPLWQYGAETAGTTAVSFPVAYKAGTVPSVHIISMTASVIINLNGAPTNTGFTYQGKGVDGSNQNQAFRWMAVGEKA